jgi:hypothetical protein
MDASLLHIDGTSACSKSGEAIARHGAGAAGQASCGAVSSKPSLRLPATFKLTTFTVDRCVSPNAASIRVSTCHCQNPLPRMANTALSAWRTRPDRQSPMVAPSHASGHSSLLKKHLAVTPSLLILTFASHSESCSICRAC